MKYFKLPDLGEGLQEAEIVEWHVREGDTVKTDQLLVSVETAKAIVQVPSPRDGTVVRLYGKAGDMLHIGEPLVEFAGQEDEDAGTVVGAIEQAEKKHPEDHFIIGAPESGKRRQTKATPAVRALARKLMLELDAVTPSGKDGLITREDVEQAAKQVTESGDTEPLRSVRRTMARNMARAHAEVAAVSLYEDADIEAWEHNADPTIRLVHAIAYACTCEPSLNVWFDVQRLARRMQEKVDVGIAVDTEDGLFVPVLRDVANRTLQDLREGLNRMRGDVEKRTIPPEEMLNPSITLSNFGTMSGRYANTVVVPPTVAIIGAGVIRDQVVAVNRQPVVHRILPLSLTFDHRVVTGGEAARFMAAMIEDVVRSSIE